MGNVTRAGVGCDIFGEGTLGLGDMWSDGRARTLLFGQWRLGEGTGEGGDWNLWATAAEDMVA